MTVARVFFRGVVRADGAAARRRVQGAQVEAVTGRLEWLLLTALVVFVVVVAVLLAWDVT